MSTAQGYKIHMSHDRPLRLGILGTARIVPKALLQPAREVPEVEILAIASRDPVRAREFAALHRIPRIFSSYEKLMNAPEIDAIYIPLPNSMHCEWTIRCLRAGKHVLCEKPIACNAAEAALMADAAAQTSRVLSEAFHYQYHPLAIHIRDLIKSGKIGDLRHIEVEFSAPIAEPNIRYDLGLGGGATMDLGCYGLNMIRFFSGVTPHVRRAIASIGPPEIDVTMAAELELPNGAMAFMKCSMASDAQVSVFFRAIGTDGEIHVTNPVAPQLGHVLTIRHGSHQIRKSVAGASTFVYQLRAFAAAIRGKCTLTSGPTEAIANMELIDRVYRVAGLKPRGVENQRLI